MAEVINAASAPAGSAANGPNAPVGQPTGQGATDYEKSYKELEGKMGGMGQELGEYRTFFQNISPLLEKLDQNPVLVQAIIDGKIDKSLAQAVTEGRINVLDAAVVSQASKEIKSDVGQKVCEAMSPEKISKLVEDKANEIRKELEEKADLRDFETRTQGFIESTGDFAEYAEEIDKWLDTHDVTDIEVAYWAVKGQLSESAAKKIAGQNAIDNAKDVLANASGGGVTAQGGADGVSMIDRLVAGPSNPIF